jgi:hypothetical protein
MTETRTKQELAQAYLGNARELERLTAALREAERAKIAASAEFSKVRGEFISSFPLRPGDPDDFAYVVGDQVVIVTPGIPSVKVVRLG